LESLRIWKPCWQLSFTSLRFQFLAAYALEGFAQCHALNFDGLSRAAFGSIRQNRVAVAAALVSSLNQTPNEQVYGTELPLTTANSGAEPLRRARAFLAGFTVPGLFPFRVAGANQLC